MKGLRSIRPLAAESLRGIEPSKVGKKVPKFEWVDPRSLYVEEAYQRDLSGNSTALIRKIVGGFSWARFKPPVCVRLPDSGNILVCIDGQHTAIAAATHPGVPKIPVMLVDAADVEDRAASFVGHNRDRLALTQMAIYHAELASGDPIAQVIDRACRAAGANILTKAVNLRNKLPVGSTIAVGTIRRIAKIDGEEFLTRVLKTLVGAGRGPVKAHEIAAVAIIARADPERGMDVRLRQVVGSRSAESWGAMAAKETAEDGARAMPDALATLWLRAIGEHLAPTKAQPPRAEPVHAEPVREPPPPVKIEPPPAAQPPEPAAPRVVVHNGVSLDLALRTVTFLGREDRVDDDGVRLVAALAHVMPAFLPTEIIAKKVFGKAADADFKVGALIERTNKVLNGVRLEVRPVAKMGWMLADISGS